MEQNESRRLQVILRHYELIGLYLLFNINMVAKVKTFW